MNFDWVTARAKCNVQCVFADLRDETEKDVRTRNEITPKQHARFRIESKSHTVFVVHREGDGVYSRIKFECGENRISVTNEMGQTLLESGLTLDDDGECELAVNGELLWGWQFRKRALHDLFFG